MEVHTQVQAYPIENWTFIADGYCACATLDKWNAMDNR